MSVKDWWKRLRNPQIDWSKPANGGRMTSIALQRTSSGPGDSGALRSPTSKVGMTRYEEWYE